MSILKKTLGITGGIIGGLVSLMHVATGTAITIGCIGIVAAITSVSFSTQYNTKISKVVGIVNVIAAICFLASLHLFSILPGLMLIASSVISFLEKDNK